MADITIKHKNRKGIFLPSSIAEHEKIVIIQMNIKKIAHHSAVAVILTALLISCGSASDDTSVTKDTEKTTELVTEAVTEEAKEPAPVLPEKDYG